MTKLLPCPFCGHDSPYFERMGTPRQSCIVECGNCGARHESSDEGESSGRQWNQRATPPAEAVTDAMVETGARALARLMMPGSVDDEWPAWKHEARSVIDAALAARGK